MRLSIITVNRNHKTGLAATIAGVAQQTFRGFEHIIIDGASADGGAELARGYAAANPSFVKCVSEPDSGIYNAMNKGIALASGEYLLFLNSGDTFAAPDVLEKVFAVPRTAGILFGDVFLKQKNGPPTLVKAPPRLTPLALFCLWVCHQAEFYRRELLTKFGMYDENVNVFADCELSVRFLRNGATDERLGFATAVFEGGGVSAKSDDPANDEFWDRLLGPETHAEYEYIYAIGNENRNLKATLAAERATPRAVWANFVASVKWHCKIFSRNK